jgi:hypothetical protein
MLSGFESLSKRISKATKTEFDDEKRQVLIYSGALVVVKVVNSLLQFSEGWRYAETEEIKETCDNIAH